MKNKDEKIGVHQSYLCEFGPVRLSNNKLLLTVLTVDLASHLYRSQPDRFGAVILDIPYRL